MDSRLLKIDFDAGKIYYEMTTNIIHGVLKHNAYVYGGAVRDYYRHKCIMTKYYQRQKQNKAEKTEKPEEGYLVPNDIDVFLRDHSQLDKIIEALSKTLHVTKLRDTTHRYKMGKKYSLAVLHIHPHYLPKLATQVDITYNTHQVTTGYPMPCVKRIDLDVNGLILSADGLRTYMSADALIDMDWLILIQKQIKRKTFTIRANYIERNMEAEQINDRKRLLGRILKMETRGWTRKHGYDKCPYVPTSEKCEDGDCICGEEWVDNKEKINFRLGCCKKLLCFNCIAKSFQKDLAVRYSIVCPYCRKDCDYENFLY